VTERTPRPLEPFTGAARSAALEKVDVARRAVVRAEEVLRASLGSIESAPRADKVTVSLAVRAAFEDLNQAKNALSDLEDLVAPEKPSQSDSDGS
jgi:ribosomal protein L5